MTVFLQLFFYGALHSYKDFCSKGSFSLIAVVFQPYFLNILLQAPAKEARNQVIAVEDVLKDKLDPFQESILSSVNPLTIIDQLNIFFTEFLKKETGSDYHFITAVQQYILQNREAFLQKSWKDSPDILNGTSSGNLKITWVYLLKIQQYYPSPLFSKSYE